MLEKPSRKSKSPRPFEGERAFHEDRWQKKSDELSERGVLERYIQKTVPTLQRRK